MKTDQSAEHKLLARALNGDKNAENEFIIRLTGWAILEARKLNFAFAFEENGYNDYDQEIVNIAFQKFFSQKTFDWTRKFKPYFKTVIRNAGIDLLKEYIPSIIDEDGNPTKRYVTLNPQNQTQESVSSHQPDAETDYWTTYPALIKDIYASPFFARKLYLQMDGDIYKFSEIYKQKPPRNFSGIQYQRQTTEMIRRWDLWRLHSVD